MWPEDTGPEFLLFVLLVATLPVWPVTAIVMSVVISLRRRSAPTGHTRIFPSSFNEFLSLVVGSFFISFIAVICVAIVWFAAMPG